MTNKLRSAHQHQSSSSHLFGAIVVSSTRGGTLEAAGSTRDIRSAALPTTPRIAVKDAFRVENFRPPVNLLRASPPDLDPVPDVQDISGDDTSLSLDSDDWTPSREVRPVDAQSPASKRPRSREVPASRGAALAVELPLDPLAPPAPPAQPDGASRSGDAASPAGTSGGVGGAQGMCYLRDCRAPYRSWEEQVQHFRTQHLQAPSYICPHCLVACHSAVILTKHTRKHGNKKRGFGCRKCSAHFLALVTYREHMKQSHDEED